MKERLYTLLISLCFIAFSSSAQIPSYVPTNGLVGWWPFNGNANDESGNGNNGNVNGATLTTDRFGVANKAYSFDGMNNPSPNAYRVPTSAELDEERLSWSSNNSAGAFASPLKFPMAGLRNYSSGQITYVGTDGAYWSSSSLYLGVNSFGSSINSAARASGISVRCIKN